MGRGGTMGVAALASGGGGGEIFSTQGPTQLLEDLELAINYIDFTERQNVALFRFTAGEGSVGSRFYENITMEGKNSANMDLEDICIFHFLVSY